MKLEFSNGLMKWYWEQGSRRVDKYSLPLSGWVNDLYEARDGMVAVAESSRDTRPAFAVWGPSQTGKSMLVSAFFDRLSIKKRVEGEDGRNSALYWPGGLPCYFMMPDEFKSDPPPWINLLNPFRLGKDASACLSRFSLGSATPTPGRYYVHSPLYPIEIKFLNKTELLHVMGRGYDTECLGPHGNGSATIWTVDKFRDQTQAVKGKLPSKPGPVNKAAFEMLRDVCGVFDSMVLAELVRYNPLVAEGLENWKNILAGLLDDPQFNSNPELVEALAAEVLWDSAQPLTDAYRRIKKALEMFEGMWGKRTIHCDLQVAALLLDMDSVLVAFDGPPPDAGALNRDRQISEQIRQLRYKIDGDRVFLGLSPALPNLLNLSPDDYGHLQSLVLELVIPVNPDFVEESNFKKFLAKSDLLDFPGVGNDANAKFTRIDLGFGNIPTAGDAPTDIPPENRFPKYNPRLLFTKIIKRGKTATIVSLYARKLKIDGFSIFLALDKNPPAKPSELNEGINTWWKCAVINYYKGVRNTKSPLPLNLVLLWWANLINEAGPSAANFMTRVKWIYDPLGDISNPAVANFFTLNYYRIAHRGGVLDQAKLKPDSFFVRGITGEAEFKRVFGAGDASGFRSFMKMMEDAETGGAEFYFNELCLQLEKPVLRRDQILAGVVESSKVKILSLLAAKDLFPEPEEHDVRREILEAMRAEIFELIDKSDERLIAQINHLLRETLNIDFRALKPVPSFAHEVNTDFIRSQFASWVTSQCNRVDAWRKSSRLEKPDWTILGLDSRDKLRSWLEALVASLEAQLLPTARWLKDMVEYNSGRPGTDLRRILAIQMGNILVYGKAGPPTYEMESGDSATFDDNSVDLKGTMIKGRECASYKVFLQPFLERQLERLLMEGVGIIQRQAQPGDEELRKLCLEYECLPESAKPKT
jgi:hypothetical protein